MRPITLFAAAGAAKPDKILVSATGHAAAQSAAKILAKKLELEESAIQTYEGEPKATAGAIVLALATDGKLAAAEMPKVDGYTATYAGGTVVWGARRGRLLCGGRAAPLGWEGGGYRRNPEFALRNSTWHPDMRWRSRRRYLGRTSLSRTCRRHRRWRACGRAWRVVRGRPRAFCGLGSGPQDANAATVKEFRDADVEVYALLPYGNNFATWSPLLYAAICEVIPERKGHADERS